MAGLGLIFPLVAFYLGDDFIMNMAEYYMKQGDVSQTMTYYDRLEAFYPQSPRISEEQFYRAGLLLQKDSYAGRMVFRFSSSADEIQKPGRASAPDSRVLMESKNSQNIQEALNIFKLLSKDHSGNAKTAWIKGYIPWLEAKCYYELGDSDRAAELLEEVKFDSPEASWPLTIRVRILLDRGNYADAREMVDEFLNKSGQSGQGMIAELYELARDAYLVGGLPDKALTCYEKAKSFVHEQFSWLSNQRFIKFARTEFLQESLQKELDEKIARAEGIKSSSEQQGGEGIFGHITENGRPVIGQKIFIAELGEDINLSGRYDMLPL